MAMTKCRECKKEISTKAEQCPHCGNKPTRLGCLHLILLCFIVFIFAQFFIEPSSTPERPRDPVLVARELCQYAIKQFALDPEKAEIPYVVVQGPEYNFVWSRQTKLLRLRNKLGMEMAVEGQCQVSKATGAIMRVVIDGTLYAGK